MLKVLSVEARDDYTLFVKLSDGRKGIFDVKPYLDKGIFVELKNIDYFKQVKPLFCGITWPHEQDFCVDTIELRLKPE